MIWAWSRIRFVRFAADESQATTLALLAECFETLGGVPAVVLADRMACLKGGVVANVVVPAPGYLAFAAHYGFRPDFCEAADPESKGVVENLVGYAKADLLIPGAPFADLATANTAAVAWCAEVNGRVHSETSAVPDERLTAERPLLRPLPSLRPAPAPTAVRTVDRLRTVRYGSARYSVPGAFIGTRVDLAFVPVQSSWGGRTSTELSLRNSCVAICAIALKSPSRRSSWAPERSTGPPSFCARRRFGASGATIPASRSRTCPCGSP